MTVTKGPPPEYITTVGVLMVMSGLPLLYYAHRRTNPIERDGAMTGALAVLAPGIVISLLAVGRWLHGNP